jgi:hypothetical protein
MTMMMTAITSFSFMVAVVCPAQLAERVGGEKRRSCRPIDGWRVEWNGGGDGGFGDVSSPDPTDGGEWGLWSGCGFEDAA